MKEINNFEKELIKEIKEEELKDFVNQVVDKEEELEELSREEFFLEVNDAFDYHAKNFKTAQDNMQIAINLITRANSFEQDPDLRVTYLKFPDGMLGMSTEPKNEMGFKHERDK